MKKSRIYLIIGICYLLTAGLYFGGGTVLAKKELEYRMWVDLSARILLWCTPFLLVGILLWKGTRFLMLQGKRTASGALLGCFVLFIIISTMVTVYMLLLSALKMETEARMPDGNLVVNTSDGYNGGYSYYAEPIGIFARKKFSWDSERYAESLSKIYDTEFIAVQDEDAGTVYHSEDYPGLNVRVWGTGYRKDDYLQENLSYLATSAELDKKGPKFFQGAARLTRYEKEENRHWMEEPDAYMVTALTVYGDRLEEAAGKIALFIQEELLEARRTDGKGLWENMRGRILIILKSSEKDSDSHYFTLLFGQGPKESWVYNEEVTQEEILSRLEQEFSSYKESRRRVSEDASQKRDFDASEETADDSLETEYSAEQDLAALDTDIQNIYNQINDGYVAIYVSEFAGPDGNRFLTDQDAKGNQETIVYEDENVVRFLRYDRESQNKECLLYVYYESDKYEDGGYSPTEARILDMYAYVIETGKVISSGRTTWSEMGTKEYRKATGE